MIAKSQGAKDKQAQKQQKKHPPKRTGKHASFFRESWHAVPFAAGMVLVSVPILGTYGSTFAFRSLNGGGGGDDDEVPFVIVLLEYGVFYLLVVLPFGIIAVACLLQVFDMDGRLLRVLKRYRDEGVVVNGTLAERPNDNRSRFLLRYQFGDAVVMKMIRVNDEKEKGILLSSSSSSSTETKAVAYAVAVAEDRPGGGTDGNESGGGGSGSGIPLLVLPPHEGSAVAQSWLESSLKERTSQWHRMMHLMAASYGLMIFFQFGYVVELGIGAFVYLGILIILIPLVHVHLLHRNDQLIQSYLYATNLGIPLRADMV